MTAMKMKMVAIASMTGSGSVGPGLLSSPLWIKRASPYKTAMPWRRAIEPWTRPLFFLWSRLTRAKTLGVRGVVTDADGRILLVQHTYLPGWWLPGGGVDRGETGEQAVIRELREEAGVVATSRPRLISVHANERFMPGDHVLVYRVDSFTLTDRTSHLEIADARFWPLDALPPDLNRGAADRLAEIFGGREVSADW